MLQIDLLRGLAIVSVVLLHGMTGAQQAQIQTAFHIAQAVPVFLLLMAFNAKRSLEHRHADLSMSGIYRSPFVWRRLRRLTVPLVIAIAVSAGLAAVRGVPLYFGWLSALLWLPVPLPGQFFVAISIAFAVVAPLVYAAYRRAPAATLVACMVANLLFESVATRIPAFVGTYYLYQVVPLRFAVLFGLGMWLATGAGLLVQRNWFVLPFAVISVGYLAAHAMGFRLPFFDEEHMYNMLAAGYPLLIVAAGLTWLPAEASNPASKALAEIGRASYHIFLVQGVWFAATISVVPYGDARWVPVSIAVTCGVGWFWYRLGRALSAQGAARISA